MQTLLKRCVFAALCLFMSFPYINADKLIIVHNNDSHSQIDPADNGLGGMVRRKVIIDSIRAEHPNVLLVDAGDAVQGTMYFTIYKGEVEYGLLDIMGYDVAVMGNHEFDNGVESLARQLKDSQVTWLSANYDLTGAPGLDSIFVPMTIKEYNGKKIGIFGINLVPEGMIAEGNYDGVIYMGDYDIAEKTAAKLRSEGADYVIAVTHIGYDGRYEPTDSHLAARTTGIDLIIGGHSHSLISPDAPTEGRFHWKHLNADGDTVAVVQAGSRGAYMGIVELDMDNGDMEYKLLTVDERYDSRADSSLIAVIDKYRLSVDSIMTAPAGVTARKLGKDDAGLMNFLGDFVAWRGGELINRPIDFSLINGGGVRRELPEGEISKGMLIDMLPFNNRVVVLEINGADLLEAINGVIRRGGIDGVKEGTDITYNPGTNEYITAYINGEPIKRNKTYLMATIDYLANGGDYMTMLPRATEIARSRTVLYDDVIRYVAECWSDTPIDASPLRRIKPVGKTN